MGKRIIVTSTDEMPKEYASKFSKEVLDAYFRAGHTLTLNNTKTGMRFYCDDGRRVKRDEHIQNFLYDEAGNSVIKEGYTNTLPNKLKKICNEKTLADFLSAGYQITIQRGLGIKTRYYLPDDSELLSHDDLNRFLCSKRPPLTQAFFDDIVATAAKIIPGAKKKRIYIDTPENENTANLCIEVGDNTYTQKILPYVTYSGTVEPKLFEDFYRQCTDLQEQNKLDFAKKHNLDSLKEIAYAVLSDDNIQNETSLLKRFQIEFDKIESITVELQYINTINDITICTNIGLSDNKNVRFNLSVPYGTTDETLKKKYGNAVRTKGKPAIAKIQSFYVSPTSPIHTYVYNHCETIQEVKKTYTKGNIVIDGVVHPIYKKQLQNKLYPVDSIIVPTAESSTNFIYCNVSNMMTIQLDPETESFKECVYMTFSTLEDFLDKSVNSLLGYLSPLGKALDCHAKFELVMDYTQKCKNRLRCYAKLTDVNTNLTIADMNRSLKKRLETDVIRSQEEIPDNYIDTFLNANSVEMKFYRYSHNGEWLDAVYNQIKDNLGPLGYSLCEFFAKMDDRMYCKTDLLTQFTKNAKTEYKQAAIKEALEQFLQTSVPVSKDSELMLFVNATAENYYQSFDVFKPASKYLLKEVSEKYDTAALVPPIEHFAYLTKDAQYRILTEKCKTAKTEEDAFAVISCLETQPQTVRKQLFTQEHFRDIYMLLNDADRMFADILISDCAGCVKLLKSLQKEVEEKA